MKQGKARGTQEKLKIFTLSVPPSPEAPYLHPVRHSGIIKAFEEGINACYTMNSMGEVDFYLQLNVHESFEDYVDALEDYKIIALTDEELEISLFYNGEDSAFSLYFSLQNPMDRHILTWLTGQRRVNLYYIAGDEDDYLCIGLKVSELPFAFTYDLERFLHRQRALLLPAFAETSLPGTMLNKNLLLQKGWGVYLNYTAMVRRIGNVDDTEEIISRYLLDLTAWLQLERAKQKDDGQTNEQDFLLFWVGRRIGLFGNKEPIEYYSVYLSGNFVQNKSLDTVKRIIRKSMGELPELQQVVWASPLAEEGIPLLALQGPLVYRFELTNDFYDLSERLFKEFFLPHSEYVSYYNRILNYRKLTTQGAKVYSLVQKRKEKGKESE